MIIAIFCIFFIVSYRFFLVGNFFCSHLIDKSAYSIIHVFGNSLFLLIHSFIHSFIHTLNQSFFISILCLSLGHKDEFAWSLHIFISFVQPIINLFIDSFIHSYIHIHFFFHYILCLFMYTFIHNKNKSLIYLFTHISDN